MFVRILSGVRQIYPSCRSRPISYLQATNLADNSQIFLLYVLTKPFNQSLHSKCPKLITKFSKLRALYQRLLQYQDYRFIKMILKLF